MLLSQPFSCDKNRLMEEKKHEDWKIGIRAGSYHPFWSDLLREYKGSAGDLALLSGYSYRNLNKLLKKELSLVRVSEVYRIARAAEVDLDLFYGLLHRYFYV